MYQERSGGWVLHNSCTKAIKAYNGAGSKAREYANNETNFISYSKEVVI